jgi:hypothetical protein
MVVKRSGTFHHARLFDRWYNSSHTEFWGWEEYDGAKEGRYYHWPVDSTWRGRYYTKKVAASSLNPTKYCQYQVLSGTTRRRSGPGTDYTGEGTLASGTYFTAPYETISRSGKYWMQYDSTTWVASGDTATISRTVCGAV